jgi:uncharacterized glyoxalase superfamily protein PhnB
MMGKDRISIMAELAYDDPVAALDWLAKAFGFETRMIVSDPEGKLVFAETGWGDHTIGLFQASGGRIRSPRSLDGTNTSMMQMRSNADIDQHCVRARAAGAIILSEPETLFFGDRTYLAADLEGHVWNFGQRGAHAGGPPPPGWTVYSPPREKRSEPE